MSTYTDSHGKLKWANIALTSGATISTLSTLAAIGAVIAIFVKPALLASIGLPLPATLVALGILAISLAAVALLAIYGISKNNKVSEMEGPKLVYMDMDMGVVEDRESVILQVTREDYKHIYTDNKNKDEKGNPMICCAWNGKRFNFAVTDSQMSFGNYKYLRAVTENVHAQGLLDLLTLGDNKERPIDILPSSKVATPKAEAQGEEKGQEK